MPSEEVRVVLVDDDPDVIYTLGHQLELDGYSVRAARDAPQAIALVRAHQPVCVLVDLGLPGIDGCELTRQLREEHGEDMILVAITGWSRHEDLRRAEAAGIDHILPKPVDAQAIRRLLPPVV